MTNENYMVTDQPIHPEKLYSEFNNPACGGVVTFVGKVRNHHEGKKVTGLTYEAYIPMAEKMLAQIGQEAITEFKVDMKIVHRVGNLKVGDVAVWIGVWAGHRREAFAACSYAIDEIKKRVPIWKKEHYVEGESHWVECQCPRGE